jgi:hypothetical protein
LKRTADSLRRSDMFIEMRGELILTPVGVICRFPARDTSLLSGRRDQTFNS